MNVQSEKYFAFDDDDVFLESSTLSNFCAFGPIQHLHAIVSLLADLSQVLCLHHVPIDSYKPHVLNVCSSVTKLFTS